MKALILLASLITSLSPVISFGQSDIRNSKDHPLISRFPGTAIVGYHTSDFEEFMVASGPLTTEIISENPKSALPPTKAFEGNVTSITYKSKNNAISALSIFRNYQKAFADNDFQPIFTCKSDNECGRGFVRHLYWYGDATRQGQNPGLNAPNTIGTKYTYYYWSGKAVAADESRIVSLLVSQHSSGKFPAVVVLDINKVETLNDKQVGINLDGMQDDISNTGKVVLSGVFFDFDKATLKPSSANSVQVIAEYLQKNPDKKFYVVGHTDHKGSFDYNLKLSHARAVAVVKELVSKYNIQNKRLQPFGAGPVSPVTSNLTEEGRTLNRRVEMVLQD